MDRSFIKILQWKERLQLKTLFHALFFYLRSFRHDFDVSFISSQVCMNCASIKTALVMTLNPLIRIRPNLSITSEQKWQAFKIVMNDSRKVRSFAAGSIDSTTLRQISLPSTTIYIQRAYREEGKSVSYFILLFDESRPRGFGKKIIYMITIRDNGFFSWAWIVDGLLLQIFEALLHAYNNAEEEKVKSQFSFYSCKKKFC